MQKSYINVISKVKRLKSIKSFSYNVYMYYV